MTYAESPLGGKTPPDWEKKIIHATVEFGDQGLTGLTRSPASIGNRRGLRCR